MSRFGKHTKETVEKMKEAWRLRRLRGYVGWNKGLKHSKITRKRISESNKGRIVSEETKRKISKSRKGKCLGHTWGFKKGFIPWNMGTRGIMKPNITSFKKGYHYSLKTEFKKGEMSLEKHPNWIADRTKIKLSLRRTDPVYKQWRKDVLKADKERCQLEDEDCKGKLIAHHIKQFSFYPELRYEVSNGITLCHHHHPKTRIEEERLEQTFKEIVSKRII